MKMRKNWKIEYYGDKKRLVIKKIGRWTMSLDIDGDGYHSCDLMVDDGYRRYYMNDSKAWNNFYSIPKTVVNWCENIGIKYLKKFLEEKYLQ